MYPYAQSHINPNIVFASASPWTNIMTYYITNAGIGSNRIGRAEILIPNAYLNSVTAVSSINPVAITNKSDMIVLIYSNSLLPGAKDEITLQLVNTINNPTNVLFDLRVYNPYRNDLGTTYSGWSKMVSVVGQASISIFPNTNFTTDITNVYNSFIVKNGNFADGRDIYRARVAINTQFYNNSTVTSYNHNRLNHSVQLLTY